MDKEKVHIVAKQTYSPTLQALSSPPSLLPPFLLPPSTSSPQFNTG